MHIVTLFVKNPVGSAAYLLLILALISLWCNRKIWIWGTFFALSLLCGYFGAIVTVKGMISLGILLVGILLLTQEIPSFIRLFVSLFTIGIAMGMFAHIVPGFYNLEIIRQWQRGPDAEAITFFLNYDKASAGLLILAFLVPLAITGRDWAISWLTGIPWACLTGLILWGLANLFGTTSFDPRIPMIALIWIIRDVFFVVIPEEALFRGLIQREIVQGLDNRAAGALAVLTSALVYAFFHVLLTPILPLFLLSFTAGLLYGSIYQITQRIESAILVHFAINFVHFFFFT